jgi:hypothetical protein
MIYDMILHSPETSGTKYPVRQCPIPFKRIVHPQQYENLDRTESLIFKIISDIVLSRFIIEQTPSIRYIRVGFVSALRIVQ